MMLPGSGFDIKTVNMDFHYSELSDVYTPEARDLMDDPGLDWRYACRNLSDDGVYCEL